jgi:16S rRNA (cytidine1402-2'-O)-methyltransferase
MTPRAIDVLRSVHLIAAEDTRHSARLAQAFDIATPMISYHQHNQAARENRLLAALDAGDVALISDAGTPAISDPGHELVAAAIAGGHRVSPVPGASSMLAAISASGVVPGPFVFLGFIARSGEQRRVALGKAVSTGFPFVLFESPLRTADTLEELATIAGDRPAVVARELTKLHEEFARGSLGALADTCAASPPRGEVVIVVGEAAADVSGPSADDAESLARSILAQGIKPSKAARELSGMTGMPAVDAYALIQRLTRNGT